MNGLRIGIACLCVAMSTFPGCGKSSDTPMSGDAGSPPAAVSVRLLDVSGCKEFATGIPMASAPSDVDCVEWWYVGGNTLHLKHVNAGFNCCPVVDADIVVEGAAITVEEIEIEGNCYCLCLFDLEYKIENLAPAVYDLRFIEPYRPAEDPVLEVSLDLASSPSGRLCVSRSQYPWGF
jgi:hypothetical protein